MNKVVKEPITLDDIHMILSKASKVGADIEEVQGVLNDDYIIYGMGDVRIDEQEPTEYIIIVAEYATSWSNRLYLIRTDDVDVVKHYEKYFDI